MPLVSTGAHCQEWAPPFLERDKVQSDKDSCARSTTERALRNSLGAIRLSLEPKRAPFLFSKCCSGGACVFFFSKRAARPAPICFCARIPTYIWIDVQASLKRLFVFMSPCTVHQRCFVRRKAASREERWSSTDYIMTLHILASRTLVVLITADRPAQFSLAARSLVGACGPSSRWKDGRGGRSMARSSISSVSTLSPKPCHTCGREISPRAKWARNWDSIKFCSDHCKGWKSIVRMAGTNASSGAESRDHLSEESSDGSLLARCVEKKEEEKGDVFILHLDAWIEGTILQLAHTASRNKGKAKDGAIPLQQVSDQMDEHVTNCQLTSLQTKICDHILQQNPQKREMIRRAARRLTILPSSQWSYTRRFGADSQRIVLSQDHGRTPLTSLQDISFAKGEMYIQASQSSETRD